MPNFYLSGGDYFLDGNPLPLLLGKNYLFVSANGTDTENAAELQAAYDQAKTLSPSSTNRITIICGPGYYNFASNAFVMDTQYIDLVSLDGNRSIVFNSADPAGTISITANDVFVKGVDVQDKNFTIGNNLNLLRVENCKGGNQSFGSVITVSGTFTNCEGGAGSFGGLGTASGTFTNCVGGIYSFGALNGTASGTFTNCQGSDSSFGGEGMASGTFTNCQGTDNSFGGRTGTASGDFKDCVGGAFSFAGGFGFQPVVASGNFINCIGGSSSFGAEGLASGTFINCIGDNYSFGGSSFFNGTASGTFTNCQGGEFSFGGFGTASGIFNRCTGGDLSFGSQGTVSGTFENCVGGNSSWVTGIGVTGKLYFSRISSGQTSPTAGLGGNIVAFVTPQNNFIMQDP